MDYFLRLFCFLIIGVVANNAASLPAQDYWHALLPNTRMPTSLSNLLNSGNGRFYFGGSNWKLGSITPREVGHDHYAFAATDELLHDNLQLNNFFLEQDLYPGSKMNLQFDKINDVAKFLSRSEAESIPHSSEKLQEIISWFSVQPGSHEEKALKETLRWCEEPGLNGEEKLCATSLEAIADFIVSSLGTTDVIAVSTTVHSEGAIPMQEYTILSSGVINLAQEEIVACHQQSYPYAVFYCHLAKPAKSYMVKMIGKDGTAVEAVAVCHTDTSAWNPKHVAFQVLNVKPGTVPVCHFFPYKNHVVFSRDN